MSQRITCETALALKKAGFPQDGDDYGYMAKDGMIFSQAHPDNKKHSYVPTLSELIEACAPSEKWMVIMTVTDKGSIAAKMGQTGVGLVPEEAVAKLWLALHPITHL